MREYFKFELDWNPRYWKFYTFVPREIYKWCECFFQRGTKGYCYKDVWSIDGYLCEIIPQMLKQLKQNQLGFPTDLTSEEWDGILDEIIEGFERGSKVHNYEATEEDMKVINRGLELFAKYYFHLWD